MPFDEIDYGVREWVWSLRRRAEGAGRTVAEQMVVDDAALAAFEAPSLAPATPLCKDEWRALAHVGEYQGETVEGL